MSYFDRLDKRIWNSLGESYAKFNPYSLTLDEIKRSEIIAKEIIENYSDRKVLFYPEMTFGSVLQGTSLFFYDLGLHTVAADVVSILANTSYYSNGSICEENFTVQSTIEGTGAKVAKKCLYVEVPTIFTSTSIGFVAHEVSHIIKESNHEECRGIYSNTEVLPILIEMIYGYEKKDNNIFKKREILMLDIAKLFINLTSDKNDININENIGFEACYRQCILYLNSFYYSLKLLAMYIKDKEFVLNLIGNVLGNNCTTKHVIDIYLNDSIDDYSDGLMIFRDKLMK